MNKLVLIGGGGHCRSVLDTALRSGCFDEIVITDQTLKPGTSLFGSAVVGTDEELPRLRDSGFNLAFITVGSIQSTEVRERLTERTKQIGFIFPIIIDPSAAVSKNASIDEGTFIGKHAVVNAGVKIGKHCIINTGAIIEHDCAIGDFSHVSVGAILCGDVQVGDRTLIGAGSTVIQGVHIGNRVIVGANSTVLRNINDEQTAYGLITREIC